MRAGASADGIRALGWRAVGLALVMALGACGGPPAPVEVTEPWTSGDERALGIEEPGAEPAQDGQRPPASASASGSD